MATLTLIRHGQASFGAEVYDQLSELGMRQSRLLGDWLAQTGATAGAVICGGMKRHRQTADACLDAWKQAAVPVQIDPQFSEFDHEELVRRHPPDALEADRQARLASEQADPRRAKKALLAQAMARWVGGRHDADYPESWTQFRARCVAGWRGAVLQAQAQDVWVFTSGGPICAILQHVLGMSDDRTMDLAWSIYNSGATQFHCRKDEARLSQFNTIPHLVLARDPAVVTHL